MAILASLLIIVSSWNTVMSIIKQRYIRCWIGLLAVFFVYYYFVVVLNCCVTRPLLLDKEVNTIIKTFVEITSIYLVALAVSTVRIRKCYSNEDIVKAIVEVGVIQSIIGICSFLFPSVKDFFTAWTMRETRSEIIYDYIQRPWRNYGFASQLYDSFGFAMAIMCALSLSMAMRRGVGNKKYFLYAAVIAFVASLNSRTSIILIGVGALVVLIGGKKIVNIGRAKQALIVLASTVLLIIIYRCLFMGGSSYHSQWFSWGIDDMRALLSGKKEGTIRILFEEHLFFPDSMMDIILGTGLLPSKMVHRNSDIGYVQNIWKYGMIGSLMIVWFYAYGFHTWRKRTKENLPLAIAAMLAVYLFKSNVLNYGIGPITLAIVMMSGITEEADTTNHVLACSRV